MKRVLWPLCAVALLGLSAVIGCADCLIREAPVEQRPHPAPNPNRPTLPSED